MVLLAYHQGYSREELAQKFARPVATGEDDPAPQCWPP